MTGWQVSGACRGHDPELWFRDDSASVSQAQAVCGGCPVRAECAEAGADEPDGVWGGVPADERLAPLLLADPEPPPHVPSRGCYVGGCRRPECCEANTRWQAAYRHRDPAAPATGGGKVEGEQLSIGWEVAS